MKAPVPRARLAEVAAALGAPSATLRQVDAYYGHPQRDFGATDEALRVRVVDGRAELTYKGPKLDRATKTRLEVTTGVGDADALARVLGALGFREVAIVRKTRRVHDYAGFEAALDEVEGLDLPFLELERTLPDGADTSAARADAERALAALGLPRTERRSYLEMLLEKKGHSDA